MLENRPFLKSLLQDLYTHIKRRQVRNLRSKGFKRLSWDCRVSVTKLKLDPAFLTVDGQHNVLDYITFGDRTRQNSPFWFNLGFD